MRNANPRSLAVVACALILSAPGLGTVAAAADPPGAPANLRVTQLEPDRITVTWDATEGAFDYSAGLFGLGPLSGSASVRTAGLSATFDGLHFGNRYSITVSARGPGCCTILGSSRIEVTTPLLDGYETPTAPPDVRVVRAANGGIERVEWDASAGFGRLTYQVYVDYTEAPLLGGPQTLECRTFPDVRFCDDLGPLHHQFLVPPPPGATLHLWVTATDFRYQESPPSERIALQF